jgi:V/A-type H+-transporting ATPase subunit E
MGLEELVARIEEEARLEVEEIYGKAREELTSIKSEAEERTTRELESLNERLEKDLANTRNVHISDGKRKARQALLSAKEDLIWETISLVRKRFSEMKESELSLYLEPMYEKASRALDGRMSVYPVRNLDASVLSGKSGMEETLEGGSVLPESVSRFRNRDLIGGFIAVSSEGRKVVNMSFSGLLEKEEERIREKIARMLFGE